MRQNKHKPSNFLFSGTLRVRGSVCNYLVAKGFFSFPPEHLLPPSLALREGQAHFHRKGCRARLQDMPRSTMTAGWAPSHSVPLYLPQGQS